MRGPDCEWARAYGERLHETREAERARRRGLVCRAIAWLALITGIGALGLLFDSCGAGDDAFGAYVGRWQGVETQRVACTDGSGGETSRTVDVLVTAGGGELLRSTAAGLACPIPLVPDAGAAILARPVSCSSGGATLTVTGWAFTLEAPPTRAVEVGTATGAVTGATCTVSIAVTLSRVAP